MENSSTHHCSPLSERTLPASLPRSVSLNAIESRRHSGLLGSFYSNLNTILEPDRASRRASTFEASKDLRRGLFSGTFADDIENDDMQSYTREDDGDAPSDGSMEDSHIPPVPRIPSMYGRQNAEWNSGRSRGQLSGRRPVQNRPPVSYDRQRNGNILPTPDPLHSMPTVAGSGLTASASFNNLRHPNRSVYQRGIAGSQYTSTSRLSSGVSAYSTIPHRDSMSIRHPRSHNQAEPVLSPATHISQENVNPRHVISAAAPFAAGDGKIADPKRPSPRHQRSIFGLRKTSEPAVASSQTTNAQDSIRPKISTFQLRKTTSGVMNLDQVAKGAAPVSRDSQPTVDIHARDQVPASQNVHLQTAFSDANHPIAKRQRSRFQLRKLPVQFAAPTTSNSIVSNVEPGSSTPMEQSMQSDGINSLASAVDESLHKKRQISGESALETIEKREISLGAKTSMITPKASRSLFGLRKTPISVSHSSIIQSAEGQAQAHGRDGLVASPRQYHSVMNLQQTSSSRIPSPVTGDKGRNFSTPVLPSQKKEDIQARKLLRPVSPSRSQGPAPKAIPKARTMGMLSNLTSTFTRSSTNLADASSFSIASVVRTAEPTTSVSNTAAAASQLSFKPNPQHITEAQHPAWWAGRFMSINDRFLGEMMEATINDPETFRSFQDNTRCAAPDLSDKDPKKAEEQEMYEPATTGIQLIRNNEDERTLRVFACLSSLCITDVAKKSLFDFQQNYARMNSNANWLPIGGTMEDKQPGGWVSRMTQAMSRRSERGGNQTSMGRRTGLSASVFGKRSRTTNKDREN